VHRRANFDLADPAWDEAEAQWMAELAAGGDEAVPAWEALFEAYDSLFRRHLRALGLPRDRVEERVQQVWVDLPRTAALYRGEAPVRAYLRNVLWSQARRYLLRERPREDVHDGLGSEKPDLAPHEALFQLVPAWRDDPRWPAFRECVRVGFAAFAEAHAQLAELLVRHHAEGWSVEETAAQVGSEPARVKEDLRRARAAVRGFVDGCLRLWPGWPGR
jgi:RNA polymerase sigma factor (sigma-70 family)